MALTPDEEEELELLELEALAAGGRSAPPPEPEAERPPQSTLDKARGAVQSTLRGQLLGFGDEVAGAGRTALDRLLPNYTYDFGDDVSRETQSAGDTYRMYRDDERAVQQQFADENPGTALGLTLTGALASPVNYVAPGLGAGAGKARTAQALGRAGAEGAIAGAGEAGELEDVKNAARKGAIVDMAVSGALRGTGAALQRTALADVTENWAKELTRKGRDVPAHLAAPGSLRGSLYKELVGRVPGASQALQRQERPFLRAALQKAHRAERVGREAIEQADAGVAAAKAQNKQASQAAAGAADIDKLDISRRARRAKEDAADALPVQQANIDARAARQVEALEEVMRREQATAALPPDASDELRELVSTQTDPRAVAQGLDQWWAKNGFTGVKSRDFAPDDDLARILGLDGDEAEALLGGPISGSVLMDLRNAPARASGTAGDYARGQHRVNVKKFDNWIERQLKETGDGEALAQFKNHITHYGDKQAYVKAVDAADALDGRFTGAQLAKAGPKRRRRYGEAPGQQRGKAARDATKAAQAEAEALKKAAKAQADKAKTRATETAEEEALRLKQTTRQAKEAAEKQVDTATSEANKVKRAVDQDKRTGDIAAARKTLQEYKRAAVPESASGLSQILTASVLGSTLPGIAGPRSQAGRVLAGTGLGRMLASPRVQNVVMGTTDTQRALSRLLREGELAPYARAIAATAAMEATEEEEN